MLEFLYKRFKFIESTGEYLQLIIDVFIATFRRPPSWRLIREQLFEIGVMSLSVVALTGFSTGLVLAAQSFYQLADKGLASATGLMVGKAMITELGPVLTAFMVTGRVGAAMCAELGTMCVSEQVDALQSMAVNPHRYLISPRFISGFSMLPLLTVFSIIMGIFGGYLIAVYFFKMSAASFFDPMPTYITTFDVFSGMAKAIIFGIIIVTICCYRGLTTSGGAAGVGRATTNCVVICYTVILFANFFLTIGLNLIHNRIEAWFT